jgi:hypothetical protein
LAGGVAFALAYLKMCPSRRLALRLLARLTVPFLVAIVWLKVGAFKDGLPH